MVTFLNDLFISPIVKLKMKKITDFLENISNGRFLPQNDGKKFQNLMECV
jgi:hypothetical protein